MIRILTATLALMLVIAGPAGAQEYSPALLRVLQLSYVADVSALADVTIDGQVAFEAISFPFATDYVPLSAGTHALTTSISGEPDFSASTTIRVEAGRRYAVIVDGDYAASPTVTLIDETDRTEPDSGSAALVVNLTAVPIGAVTLNDERVLDGIPAGEHASFALPASPFTLSGSLGDEPYTEEFAPLSNALLLFVVRSTPSGEPQMIPYRSSRLTVAEYLRSAAAEAFFSGVTEVPGAAAALDAMTDEGSYTLFLPERGPVYDLAARVVIASVPPYTLTRYDSLTSLAGTPLQLRFTDTASGYWEVDSAPILWDLRLANGVIYAVGDIPAS